MLTIILAESELEKIPNQILSHPSVTSHSRQFNRRPTNMILDASFHHSAMKNIPEGERRGRPDIVHISLLTALESILNKKGELKVVVHTRNNEAIYFNPETRLMKSYIRFIGLMEQLFEKKIIAAEEKTLLELCENKTLEKLIDEEKHDFVLCFSPDGKKVKLSNYFKGLKEKKHKNILCIIGGFPHGDFHNDISKYSDDVISIYDETLTAWTVAGELLVNYENTFLK